MIKETNHLLNFADFRITGDVFIETGTCYGRSVTAAIQAGYNKIRSVEAKKEFHDHCCALFANHMGNGTNEPRIDLYLGKSIDHLEGMISDLQGPAVFWLDAHVSGEKSAGYQDYMANGEKSDYHQHTVLKKELAIVLAHSPTHTILIDDQNGPNQDNAVYVKMMSDANPDYLFYWIDEQSGEVFYKNKVLVAVDKRYKKQIEKTFGL